MCKFTVLIGLLLIFFGCQNKATKSVKADIQEESIIDTSVKSNGKLISEDLKINYGIVKQGEIFNQNFIFVNEGEEAVEVLGYEKSCNCTDLILDNFLIQPQDSLNIKMIIDIKDKTLGKHDATVTLKTNGTRTFYLLTTYYTIE